MIIPTNFPHHNKASYIAPTLRQTFSAASLARLDGLGTFFLLGGTMLLITVLLEAGVSFAWNSATSISLLVVSAVFWVLFLINERLVSRENRRTKPIFPWRFFFCREWMGTLMYENDITQKADLMHHIGSHFSLAYHTTPLSLPFLNVFSRYMTGRHSKLVSV